MTLTLQTYFRENNIATYFIMPPVNRRKPHLFNTLNARNNMMTGITAFLLEISPSFKINLTPLRS